jgi:hypothetical protein
MSLAEVLFVSLVVVPAVAALISTVAVRWQNRR